LSSQNVKPNRAVLGLLWGDEGKAKIIDLLAKYAGMIVRFQGGANAGHTVMVSNQKTVLHQIPVGILRDDIVCVLGAGMVLDIPGLFDELKMLKDSGVNYRDRLFVSPRAHVVTPLCKLIEQGMEKLYKIGTTSRGIGPTYSEKTMRTGFRAGDVAYDEHFQDNFKKRYNDLEPIITKIYKIDMPPLDSMLSPLLSYREELKTIVLPVQRMVQDAMNNGTGVLFEGAQGTLLDIDWGTYPYVTSSSTSIGGLASGAGVNPRKIDQVIGDSKGFYNKGWRRTFPNRSSGGAGKEVKRFR
jgi:adenylosuccinate synthase